MRARATFSIALLIAASLAGVACDERATRDVEASRSTETTVRLTELRPGPAGREQRYGGPLERDAVAVAEGKRLYGWYNCSGCHFQGGGGIGPPLMDDEWIYGSDPENVYRAIVEGRPNGMPSYGGRIPEEHAWQIVAYVRSLSDLPERASQSSRSDAGPEEREEVETGAGPRDARPVRPEDRPETAP